LFGITVLAGLVQLKDQSYLGGRKWREAGVPKLYEYFGLIVLFYSNELDPVHVHGLYQGAECRAELIVQNGNVIDIQYAKVRGRRPLDAAHLADFKVLVANFAEDIVSKWIDFFVMHKPVQPERITRRIK
jgi:hypothetical protein